MWNPFSYLSSTPTQQQQPSIEPPSIVNNPPYPHPQLPKYLIQQHSNYHKKIQQFEQLLLNSCSKQQEQSARLIKTFGQLILEMEQFLDMIKQLKNQYEGNLEKIQDYEHCKRKLQNHHHIIEGILEGHQRDLDCLAETNRQRELSLQMKLSLVEKQLGLKNLELQQVRQKVNRLEAKNQELQQEKTMLSQKLQSANFKSQQISKQLAFLFGNKPKQLIKAQYQSKCNNPTNPMVYSKQPQPPTITITIAGILTLAHHPIFNTLLSFLTLKQILTLSLTSKHLHSSLTPILPQLIFTRLQNSHQQEILSIKKQPIYYNRFFNHEFENENLKINAIKYLFFNHKPGGYMLAMFQEDISSMAESQNQVKEQSALAQTAMQENQERQHEPKKSSWRSLFRSQKPKQPIIKQSSPISPHTSKSPLTSPNHFSLTQLKSSPAYKSIEQSLSQSFHKHVFSLKLPQDLEHFHKVMNEQFDQLKKEISANVHKSHQHKQSGLAQFTAKLLILARFLYLQSQQLWALGNHTFGQLLQKTKQLDQLNSRLQDLEENKNGSRKLIQQLAKNKLQLQKRLWQSQRKSIFLKTSAQSLQQLNTQLTKDLVQLRQRTESEQTKTYDMKRQLQNCKQKLISLNRKYNKKMDQFNEMKEIISGLDWV